MAETLLREVDTRLSAEHVSVGNAVASIKELTLCLRKAWYKRQRDPDFVPSEFEIDGLTKVLLGTAFGNLMNPLPERRVELMYDEGIVSGRVDMDLMDGANPLPVELKLTWYSAKKSLAEMSQYVEQLAGYMLATPEALGHGLLGVYHAGMPPKFRVFDITFSDNELDAWDHETARRVKAVLNKDQLPSLSDHYAFECRYCSYYEKAGGPCPGGGGKMTGFFREVE